jgi:hypothetical protein
VLVVLGDGNERESKKEGENRGDERRAGARLGM